MESAHGGERELSPEEEAESREGRLLREMMLRARREAEEEPQVPDEQLHANDQLQRDEMLALEAIYGGNISIFGEKFGLRSFEILVHCEIPDGILVSAELFQEVVYEWVQWLQSSALSHLGFDDGLAIHHSDSMMGPVDVRAVGEIVPVESVVQWLISYNEEQCHESFVSGVHNCTICLSEYAGVDFIKLPCQHYFYQRCMETYSRMHVKEGTVLKLLCPDDQCRGDVPPHLLKILLGDADFERWERLILQKTLDSMADAAYCPRCETICLEDEENNAQCSKCFFSFCTHCRIRCHIGKRCGSITPEEKLLSLREREKVRRLSDGDIEKTISLAKEILNIKEVLCLCVQCPNCGTGISRVSGCNQMVCWNCGQPFCCGCGVAGCRGCNSISARNDPEKVKELDVTPLLTAQIDAVEGPRKAPIIISSRKYPCPSCRQPNSKVENNNHIFCLACQVHYCALCRKVVRKYAEHYGPRGCKQHSVDP